jgi:hypothetical protein
MKLKVTRGRGNTQLGGDEPPVIQGGDDGQDYRLQGGGALTRLQPARQSPVRQSSYGRTNGLQPANVPMRSNLLKLSPQVRKRLLKTK